MIIKKFAIVSFVLLVSNFITTSKKIEELVNKEIRNVFQIENFQKEDIQIPEHLKKTLPKDFIISKFKKIKISNETFGYYSVGSAFGQVDYFDYLIIFDNDLIVEKIKILVYREDHGGEIRSKRWLRQFRGKSINNDLNYPKNIVGISGATLSVKVMTNAVNNVLNATGVLHKNKVL